MTNFIRTIVMLGAALFVRGSFAAGEVAPQFRAAKSVWAKGEEKTPNLNLRFAATVDVGAANSERVVLRATGASVYRIRANGEFAGYGPARGPEGIDRVDEWDLSRFVKGGKLDVQIDVAGYNCESYYLLDQPSYLRAEIVCGEKILAATGVKGFEAKRLAREQKVPRFSYQRPYSEVWRMTVKGEEEKGAVELAVQRDKQLFPRRANYPDFHVIQAVKKFEEGKIRFDKDAEVKYFPWRWDTWSKDNPRRGFNREDCTRVPIEEVQKYVADANGKDGVYEAWDLGRELSGFFGGKVSVTKPCTAYIVFDEILIDGKIDFLRANCCNVLTFDLAGAGTYNVEGFEPNTFRYAKFIVTDGAAKIEAPYMRTYENPDANKFVWKSKDEALNKIFEAARATFAQNAVDVFTDCPGRERAGWLCDSYFTARVSKMLTGSTNLERLFLENFLYAKEELPDGMFPMCYPANHTPNNFIPNWAMFLVLELQEYAARSGDTELIAQYKVPIQKLVTFFEKYENKDGILENLPSWIFIEWSDAGNFVRPISYPSNMLYVGMLRAAAALYGREDWMKKAEALAKTIRAKSFDGTWYTDDGKHHTEVCQYYAFYFGIANPTDDAALWKKLTTDFGPQRLETKAYPDVPYANAFIGNYLRLEILSRYGLKEQVLREIKGYFTMMADRTGTLWEHNRPEASCCHGFASHVAFVLAREMPECIQKK